MGRGFCCVRHKVVWTLYDGICQFVKWLKVMIYFWLVIIVNFSKVLLLLVVVIILYSLTVQMLTAGEVLYRNVSTLGVCRLAFRYSGGFRFRFLQRPLVWFSSELDTYNRDLRIGRLRSNWISNRIGHNDSNSSQILKRIGRICLTGSTTVQQNTNRIGRSVVNN